MKSPTYPNRRRIHYVDHALQKWLLLALIVMEAALVSMAIWVLYRALNTVIDEEMYRVHYSGHNQVLPLLIKEGSVVLGWMLLANALALLAADRLWAVLVNGILRQLRQLMHASQNLDFRVQDGIYNNHAALEQGLTWRQAQTRRLAARRAMIESLPDALPTSAAARAELAARLPP